MRLWAIVIILSMIGVGVSWISSAGVARYEGERMAEAAKARERQLRALSERELAALADVEAHRGAVEAAQGEAEAAQGEAEAARERLVAAEAAGLEDRECTELDWLRLSLPAP